MDDSRISFSKERLLALPLPASGGRMTYHDTKIVGLQLRVTATGSKTFSVLKRIKGGNPERITIGKFPAMTVEQARKAAAAVVAEIEGGANPAEAKRAVREELTLRHVLDEYLERKRKKDGTPLAESTKAGYVALADGVVAALMGRKLSAIRRDDVAGMLHKTGKTAPYVANRAKALVSALYGYATERELYAGGNPAAGVRGFAEKSRERFATGDELPALFQAIAVSEQRDFFLLALLTGARRANVCAMRWDELDLTRDVWRIEHTKNGDPQNVPLSAEAKAVLEARKGSSDGSPWVFPGNGKTGHLVEPKKAWASVLKRAGIENLRIHDLRRTLGSWQAMTGASMAIIGKSLNHKSPQATAIYARLDIDPVRQSVNTATAAMLEAAGLKDGAEVVKLPKKPAGAR